MIDIFTIAEEVSKDIHEEELQQRRDERLSNCMKVSCVFEERNGGGRKIAHWRCRDPRCDFCNEIKGKQLLKRVEKALEEGNVYYISTHKDIADKLCKKVGRDNYLRIPISDDEDIVFIASQEENNIDDETLREFDWTSIARRNTNRIMSGNLGKAPKNEPDGQYEVTVMDFVIDNADVAEKAYFKTCAESIVYQQPETIEEHQAIRNYFNGCYTKNILTMGGKLLGITYRKTRCETLLLKFIDWKRIDDPDEEFPELWSSATFKHAKKVKTLG
jgi:hypothetical protein